MADIPGGFVCAQGAPHGAYEAIYASYPLVGQGRESIYTSTDEGSVAAANDLLHNRFDLPRYRAGAVPVAADLVGESVSRAVLAL